MKSRKSTAIIEAYKTCYGKLTKKGFTGKLVRLDNEISKDLITAIEDSQLDYQIASPGDHRNNPAEGAINHAKAHIISVRACADTSFDERDWDLLLPHAEQNP